MIALSIIIFTLNSTPAYRIPHSQATYHLQSLVQAMGRGWEIVGMRLGVEQGVGLNKVIPHSFEVTYHVAIWLVVTQMSLTNVGVFQHATDPSLPLQLLKICVCKEDMPVWGYVFEDPSPTSEDLCVQGGYAYSVWGYVFEGTGT